MRSLVALVLAIGMVVAALYVRGAMDGGGGPLAPDEPLRVVCASELAAACNALSADGVDARIQQAGGTAEELMAAERAVADAWITLAPWPQMVTEARRRGGLDPLSSVESRVLARSPLLMVVREDRSAVLAQHCNDSYAWPCVGRVAGGTWADVGGDPTWGRIKPGHADPSVNATGLLVLGQAVSQFLDTSDFSARDLDGDRLLSWLTDLERAVPDFGAPTNTPLQQMLRLPATFDVVGTTEAEALPLLQRAGQRSAELTVRYPEPLVVAEVVLAPLEPEGHQRLEGLVATSKRALAQAGWRVEGEPPVVPQGPELPDTPNVPSAGVLDALRSRWEEITR